MNHHFHNMRTKESMKRVMTGNGAMFLGALVISFLGTRHILQDAVWYAVLLIGLCLSCGASFAKKMIGTRLHVGWLGLSIGSVGALIFSLPSAFAS